MHDRDEIMYIVHTFIQNESCVMVKLNRFEDNPANNETQQRFIPIHYGYATAEWIGIQN